MFIFQVITVGDAIKPENTDQTRKQGQVYGYYQDTRKKILEDKTIDDNVRNGRLNELDNAYNNKNWNILANYAAMYNLTDIANFFRKLQIEQELNAKRVGFIHGTGKTAQVTAAISGDDDQKKKSTKQRDAKISKEHEPKPFDQDVG